MDQESHTVPPYVVPTPKDDTESCSMLPNITASENVESNTGNSPVASPTVLPQKVPVTDVTSEPRYPKHITKRPSRLIEQM